MTPVAEQPYLWRYQASTPVSLSYIRERASIAHGTRDHASVRGRSSPYSPVGIQRGLFSARIGPKGKAARRCIVRRASERVKKLPWSQVPVCDIPAEALSLHTESPHHLSIPRLPNTNPPSPADPRSPYPHPQVFEAPGQIDKPRQKLVQPLLCLLRQARPSNCGVHTHYQPR